MRDAVAEFAAICAATVPTTQPHVAPPPSSDTLYTLTTISAHARHGGTRAVAIYRDWALAAEDVRQNMGDLWETTYDLAVIETVVADELYGGAGRRAQWWFRYEPGTGGGRYIDIERPSVYRNIVGFGIG